MGYLLDLHIRFVSIGSKGEIVSSNNSIRVMHELQSGIIH